MEAFGATYLWSVTSLSQACLRALDWTEDGPGSVWFPLYTGMQPGTSGPCPKPWLVPHPEYTVPLNVGCSEWRTA